MNGPKRPHGASISPQRAPAALNEANSPWATLPLELLIAVVAAAAPHARSLPELLAPSRVCRSWAAAFRDDALWLAVHDALSLHAEAADDDAQAAARPAPTWRERVAAATLGVSLLDRGAGPGATELPLREVFAGPPPRFMRDTVCTPQAGGHACVLNRGRLTVIHLPGSRGVASVLQEVRACVPSCHDMC